MTLIEEILSIIAVVLMLLSVVVMVVHPYLVEKARRERCLEEMRKRNES